MLGNANLDDFICGGYFLAKRVDRPPDVSNLLPRCLIKLSTCFTDIAPDTWADADYKYEDDERAAEAVKFGIVQGAVPALVKMFTDAVRPQHLANAFPSFAVAQEFYRHSAQKDAVFLLGLGLERSSVPTLRAQLQDDLNQGYGLIERVDASTSLEPGGEVLGYEPLGFEGTKFHSWLCHNAAVEAHERFGIRPNSNGFIDSLADAVRVTNHLKATGAEPAIWEPWLVVRYGISEETRSGE
jgi:hypothetical protein